MSDTVRKIRTRLDPYNVRMDFKNGASLTDLSLKYNRKRETLRRILHGLCKNQDGPVVTGRIPKERKPRQPKTRGIPLDQVEPLRNEYAEDGNVREIAKRLNVSESAVRKCIWGITFTDMPGPTFEPGENIAFRGNRTPGHERLKNVRKQIPREIRLKVIADYLGGALTIEEIANDHVISESSVYHIVNEHKRRNERVIHEGSN